MAFIQYEKLFSRKWFMAYSFIILGAFIMAAGFVLFITPHKIVPGGVYGIAIVLHHLFGFPVGLTALCFDIPLTIIGVKVLGPRFGIKTVLGFVFTAFWVDFLTYLYGEQPLIPDDVLLSSLFGGVMIGAGLGLIFKSKATSGGSDIVAMIISKYTGWPMGQLMIAVDSAIVLVGFIGFQDWKVPLYSLITIYVTGRVIDLILQGVSYDKSIFIVSKKPEMIREKIINDLNRGGTIFKAQGMYSKDDKEVIYTVLNRREVEIIQDYIHQVDPKAFLVVSNANEILGEGFKSLRDKVSDD
ncbi:MAG: YitT family protein [Bacteroidetes bacterium]|nr:YitT family protein [Bacteroidota bacterium]